MKKVLIPTKLDTVAADILKAHGAYEVVQDAKTPLATLVSAHPDTHALIVRSEKIDAATIDALPRLKVIIRAGAGFNTIDIKYARKRGVDVMNTPGANANAVAEEVLALVLADLRRLIPADASTRAGKWEKKNFMGRELTGRTVGIVGLGNIGRLVAKRLAGFDCKLLGYDPVIAPERARGIGVEPVTLDEIFAQSDIVTLHIPENDSTRKLVGARLLGLMKKDAILVNCARSGIVDEDAIRAAKAEKGIRFLNDVYPKDEEGPKSVADIADIMLPHLGANTFEANANAARRAAEELIDLDDKGVTAYIVNRDIPDGLDKAYCDLAYTISRLSRRLAGTETPIKMLETSFYGKLEKYAPWLLVPTLAGLDTGFDPSNDHAAAVRYLKEQGVEHNNRAVDEKKGFLNSITIDLIVEKDGHLKRTSVRGTVAESVIMISRINEFDRLYFQPSGHMIFCIYDDRPGVIASISRRLADAGINIEDMRNPHDPKTHRSLAILKINTSVPPNMLAQIGADINAHSMTCVNLG